MYKRIGFIFIVLAFVAAPLARLPYATADGHIPWPTNGWETSTPEAQGMDSEELAAFFNAWSHPDRHIDSLTVIRHGYVVGEAYIAPTTPEHKRLMYSSSKSVTSALVGIALGEGLFESVDEPVLTLFPGRTAANLDADKQAMTVDDVLHMAAGLECYDMGYDWQTSIAMEASDDWLQFMLDQPMAYEPGTQFNYCNGFTHILSALINEKTGMSALDYAVEKLFTPLGITDYVWPSSPTGVSFGYSELRLRPRDMAKLGFLYLHGGEWDGEQIVPADYVAASFGGTLATGWPDTSYGYQFWTIDSVDAVMALGAHGQHIIMFPDKDLMVVVTAGASGDLVAQLISYPLTYQAAQLTTADEALPENPDGVSELTAVLDSLANPEAQPVPELPTLAQEISDAPFLLTRPYLLSVGQERRLAARGTPGLLDSYQVSFSFDDSAEAQFAVTYLDDGVDQFTVGLDGLYRMSDTRMGQVGVKGEWLTDDTFRLYIKSMEDALLHRLDFTFGDITTEIVTFEASRGSANAMYAMIQ